MNDPISMNCQYWFKPTCRVVVCVSRIGLGTSLAVLLAFGGPRSGKAADHPAGKMAHGFSYQHDENRDVPWSIHIVKIDLANAELELHTTLGKGNSFGMATLSDQVKTLGPELGRAVAAINGDYYYKDRPYLGDPKGLQILRGELVSAPCDWTCFWMDPSGKPHMTNILSRLEATWPSGERTRLGLNEERAKDAAVLYTAAVGTFTHTSGGRELILERDGTNTWLPLRVGQTYSARVRQVREAGDTPLTKDILVLSFGKQAVARAPKVVPGTVLQISTATTPDLNGVKMAIGGGPPIVRGGIAIGKNDAYIRHPRSAIGWNKEYFFFVEVDGRQRNLSVGMTIEELSSYLVKLGCQEAMCFDGGGSATCWVYGQVMNSPSEGRERGMANALVLVQKK